MTHSISSDMKRALGAKGFLFGIAGMVLMIAVASISTITSIEGLQPNGFHAQLILSGLTSDDVTLVLPILCTLPFAAAFVDDIKSGFIKQYFAEIRRICVYKRQDTGKRTLRRTRAGGGIIHRIWHISAGIHADGSRFKAGSDSTAVFCRDSHQSTDAFLFRRVLVAHGLYTGLHDDEPLYGVRVAFRAVLCADHIA